MKRPSLGASLFVVAVVSGVVALANFTNVFAVSANPTEHVRPVVVTTLGNAAIVAKCDRVSPGASLGLANPTLVSRIDGSDGVIFATRTKYTACILWTNKDVSVIKPTPLVKNSRPIDETFSFANSNKIPHRQLWKVDEWFVVRVGPTVSALTAAARSSSQSSNVVDGFAFVHLTETADVHGKFAWGVAAGFNPSGEFVGSGTLR